MIWLVTRFVVVPVKAALGGAKLGFWTGKVVGYRRLAVLGTGVAIGLLVAPGPGAQLRARLKAKVEGGEAVPFSAPPRVPTSTVVVPEPVRAGAPTNPGTVAAGATGTAVPDEVMERAQDTVEATLPAPVPMAEVPVGDDPDPLHDPAAIVADDEGEALPAVPDADPAVVDPTTA